MMPEERDQYVLHGGQKGYDRLLVLARERWPDTEEVLNRAGVRPGMKCLDLGCGPGAVSMKLAALVGPSGAVTGLDMDATVLELARAEAIRLEIPNVEFRVGTVADWVEPATYDLVYSRFLLQHLRDPGQVMAKMWGALRTPGLLVIEDADHSATAFYPSAPGFEFYRKMIEAVVRRGGGDPENGRKLFHLAREAGIPHPEIYLRGSARSEGEGKGLPLLSLDAVAARLVEDGLASPAEIREARTDLARALADPGTLYVGPRIFQLIGRRS